MKKVWSILLAVLMLVSALPLGAFSMTVGAYDAPTIWADQVGGYAGDTVTVTVQMANNPGLVGWLVDVSYDENVLELVAQNRGDAFSGSLSFGPMLSPTNCLWYNFLATSNYTNNGKLFSLTFKIKDGAPVGTYPIEVYCSDPDNLCNIDFDRVDFGFVNGSVEVYEHVSGMTLDKSVLNLKNGATAALTPIITPANAHNKNVTWQSSDEEVATVANGVVTGVKRGTATITATTEDGGYKATATVNVTCANLVHVTAVAPDHYNKGHIEYWHCENCGGYFTDAAGRREVSAEDVELDIIPHSYSADWSYNEITHWNECSCGAKNNEAGHRFDNACDMQCDCGYTREVAPHVFDGLTDGYCNECGAVRVVTKFELTAPFTRIYALGDDELDVNGGYVDIAYADGAEGRVDLADAIITGYNPNAAGMQTLTVQVGSGSATYDVQVVNSINLPTIRVDVKNKAIIGQEITASILIENNPGLISLKLAIDYDPTKLELVRVETADAFADAISFGPQTATPFIANWVDALNPNQTTNGVFVKLIFKVKDDAVEGPTPITVRYNADDLFNYDFEPVLFNVVNAETKVQKCTPGDLNNDGKINIRDLGLLQQHLNGWDVVIEESAADLNADGKINIRDLGLLQQYLNGWDVELK